MVIKHQLKGLSIIKFLKSIVKVRNKNLKYGFKDRLTLQNLDPIILFLLIILDAYKFLPKKRRLHEEGMVDIKQIMGAKPNKKHFSKIMSSDL